jgi:hypothetical protein
MPETKELFFNGQINTPSKTYEWIDTRGFFEISFLSFCDQNHDVGIRWSVDVNHDVVDEEIIPVTTNTNYINRPIKTRYIQFFIQNVASTPAVLRTQSFFFVDICI